MAAPASAIIVAMPAATVLDEPVAASSSSDVVEVGVEVGVEFEVDGAGGALGTATDGSGSGVGVGIPESRTVKCTGSESMSSPPKPISNMEHIQPTL